jgi:hypothetical protein
MSLINIPEFVRAVFHYGRVGRAGRYTIFHLVGVSARIGSSNR